MSMLTSTIIPGRKRFSFFSMAIRTGRRCVIFVKLPLGFGDGNRVNSLVVAFPTFIISPEKVISGYASTFISTG